MLAWLKKNRFKNMELDLFMYSILAVAVTFVLYTAFLLFGFKPRCDIYLIIGYPGIQNMTLATLILFSLIRDKEQKSSEEENEDDVVGKKNK